MVAAVPKPSNTTLQASKHLKVKDHHLLTLIWPSQVDQCQQRQERAFKVLSRKKAEVLDTLVMKTIKSRR
jgi:hypothetical protein